MQKKGTYKIVTGSNKTAEGEFTITKSCTDYTWQKKDTEGNTGNYIIKVTDKKLNYDINGKSYHFIIPDEILPR